jgi:hypothetical protein
MILIKKTEVHHHFAALQALTLPLDTAKVRLQLQQSGNKYK